MKAVQKVTLSLLLAVVVFSLFSLFAFSGLFRVIESNFYDARVKALLVSNLEAVRSAIDSFDQANYGRFAGVLADGAVRRIYSPNQSADDIFNRTNLFQKLEADFPGLLFVRFIDGQGNIHFSTLPSDILKQTKYEIAYKNLAQADPSTPASQLELNGPSDGRVIVGDGRLLYRLPAFDTLGERRGTAIFYVSAEELVQYLVKRSVIPSGQSIALVPGLGILLNANPAQDTSLVAAVAKEWKSGPAMSEERPILADASGNQLLLFTAASKSAGLVGVTATKSEFSLNPTLRMLLSASIFITTFLVAFLILNLRQDRLLVLSERIKRFQIAFLRGYLENRQNLDWERWYRDLELRSTEVKREIKKGIGSSNKEREREVDGLIDKSWDDILSIIGKRVEQAHLAQVEVKGLEETIRRVLATAEVRLPAREALPEEPGARGEAMPLPAGVDSRVTAAPVEEAEEVEEIEEVSELEQVEEEVSPPSPSGAQAPLVAASRPSPGVAPTEGTEEEVLELEPVDEEAEPLEAPVAEAPAGSREPDAPEALAVEELAEEGAVLEELSPAEEETTPEIDEFADLGLTEVDILPDMRETVGGSDELEPVEAMPSELPSASLPAEGGHFLWERLDEVEALDLEAIFHGEELLADIDVFDEGAEEVEVIEEAESGVAILEEFEAAPVREVEGLRATAAVAEREGAEAELEGLDELSAVGESATGEAMLLAATSGFSLFRGIERDFRRTAARSAADEEEIVELDEEEAPLGAEETLEELAAAGESAENGAEPSGAGAEPQLPELEAVQDSLEEPTAINSEGMGDLPEEATPQSAGDFGAQVTLLVSKTFIEIYSLSDFSSMGMGKSEVIGVENGLFQVREEVLHGPQVAEDKDFGSLVDSVVAGESTAGEEDEIGRFLAIPTVELSFGGLPPGSPRAGVPGDPRRRPTRAAALLDLFSAEGLRYDAIRARFRSSSLGVMKSLMRVSQSVDAIYAAILLPSGGGLATLYSLGLDEQTASALSFSDRDPVYQHLLSKKRLIYIRVPATGVPAFDDKLSAKDIRFMKGSIYVPIDYEGKSGYLFFGLKDTSRSIQDYILSFLTVAE